MIRASGSHRAVRNRDVFLNCSFDAQYKRMFHASIFTIYDCEFFPRCALEMNGASELRFDRILCIISECDWGIHDISHAGLDSRTRLARFNMPLELGLFLGSKYFGGDSQSRKTCFVVDRDPYRYRKFMSDIAGQDIHSHNGHPEELIHGIRDWLQAGSRRRRVRGGQEILERHRLFLKELPRVCRKFRVSRGRLTFSEYTSFVRSWLRKNVRSSAAI